MHIRNKYEVNSLSKEELKDYSALVVGNDPVMPAELNNYCEPHERIGVVAAGGMRSVSLICKLGNREKLPKLIIVDNSLQVIYFWKAMRDFMQDDEKTGTKVLFENNFNEFLDANRHLYRHLKDKDFNKYSSTHTKYLSQNIPDYFQALFEKYCYDYVRNVISHTSIIGQSWADSETFVKIKNILKYADIHKILMYPSDIVACIPDKAIQNQILENIYLFSPALSIHTNICYAHQVPEKVILLTNQQPSFVRISLFKTPCLNQKNVPIDLLNLNDVLNSFNSDQSQNNFLDFAVTKNLKI